MGPNPEHVISRTRTGAEMTARRKPSDRSEKIIRPDLAMLPNTVPKPDEIVMVPQAVLRVSIKIGEALKDLDLKWAVGGDAGEIMRGVKLKTDHLEIVTTKAGTDEICKTLAPNVTSQPSEVERKLERDADVNGQMLPVYIRSRYAELDIDHVVVQIYGDLQYKVGEWDWGDPIDYEMEHVYLVGTRVPVLPLGLKSELAIGLGWLDRVELISDAIVRSKHHQH